MPLRTPVGALRHALAWHRVVMQAQDMPVPDTMPLCVGGRMRPWYRWEDLTLETRTRNALALRCQWHPESDPLLLSDRELLQTRHFGPHALRDFRQAQQVYEAAHPEPPPPWGHPLLTEP